MKNKLKLKLIFLTILFCGIFGLAKNSQAATYYVRPAGTVYGVSNGTTHTDAWSGFSDIVWGEAGVNPGDTLYICGTHSEMLTITSGGTDSNPIAIRGDFESDPGIIDNIAIEAGIRFDSQNYLSFYGLTFKNSQSGLVSYGGCNHIRVENCIFENQYLKGLQLVSSNQNYYVEDTLVKNCTFRNIGVWGNTGANSIGYAGYSRNTITEDCVFQGDGYSRGVDGILIENTSGNGSNHIIRRNVFSDLEENGIDLKTVVQSSLLEGPTQIYENNFTNSNQLEIVMHKGTKHVDIYRNNFHDGATAIGIVRHDGYDNDNGYVNIYYNIFSNFSSSILGDAYAEGVGNNTFLNNTCYVAGESNPSNYSIQIDTNNWNIKNNLFYHLSIGKSPHSSIRFLPDVNMATIQVSNNDHLLFSGDLAYRLPDDTYHTVLQVEENGLSVDPQFVSTTDFHLQNISPVINAGTDVGLTEDFDGNPIVGAPDIGAFEYQGADLIAPGAPSGLSVD